MELGHDYDGTDPRLEIIYSGAYADKQKVKSNSTIMYPNKHLRTPNDE